MCAFYALTSRTGCEPGRAASVDRWHTEAMNDQASRVTDRGGGLFVQGGLRISNLSLSVDATTGELTAGPITTELRADMFPHWLDIAERAAGDADAARVRAVATDLDDNEGFNSAIHDELRASLVAISAAAFAIDAFYGAVLVHAPSTKVSAGARDSSVFETLKRAFALTPEKQKALRGPLRVVYRLRDQAVHPPAKWTSPALHAAFNLGMEPKYVNFRAENAVNAQLLIRRVIWDCLRNPKTEHADLVKWCEGLRDAVPRPPDPPQWANAPAPRPGAQDHQDG